MMVILRSCVICRKKDNHKQLIRYTYTERELLADSQSKNPGRGVYLCPDCDALYKQNPSQLRKRMMHSLLKNGNKKS
jgi:predicted RNA-binding protein YlxR (DUF448 family)